MKRSTKSVLCFKFIKKNSILTFSLSTNMLFHLHEQLNYYQIQKKFETTMQGESTKGHYMDNSLQYGNQQMVEDKQRRPKYKHGAGMGEENVERSKSRGNSTDDQPGGDDGIMPRSVMEDPSDEANRGNDLAQEQYKHHKINLKQIHQQNAKSQERPHGGALSNAVQLKGKMNKNQQASSGKGGPSGQGAIQVVAGGPNAARLTDEQVHAMTRSQDPPMNRSGKNNQQRGQNKGNQGGIKQLVLEDPIGNSKVAMPPISNSMKKTQTVLNERQLRQEQKIRQQLLQRQNILAQLREDIFGEEKTRFGNIICNAFWGFWPTDDERYINPKMEDELIVFKKKIKQRFENRDIAQNFQFPRIGTTLHSQIQKKHSLLEEQSNQKKNAKSQEREILDRDMLMTLWAQPGYLSSGKIRNQSQQPVVKQSHNNRLKNPVAKADHAAKSSASNLKSDSEYPMRVEIQGTQVDIAELPEDVQKKVIEHLLQKNNDLAGDFGGSSNVLNHTDFVQISELFSPSQKAQFKEPNANSSGSALGKGQASSKNAKSNLAHLNNSHSKAQNAQPSGTQLQSGTSKGMPKVQNYVKNAERQQQANPGAHPDSRQQQSQPLFQNVQVATKGQNQQVQSGCVQISQMGANDTGYQITQKKKMQSLQPSQNQMKKNAQQQPLVAQNDYNAARADQTQQLHQNQNMGQQQYSQGPAQSFQQHEGARKLADSVKVLNSEKKKAREGMPLNSHSAMQYQYQSQELMQSQLMGTSTLDHQQKQRFKDSHANRAKQQQRGSSHEMANMASSHPGTNQHGGAKVQGGTQKLNIAEIMSPITNANIQAPTSKKSRSGANAGGYNTNSSNVVSVTHRNVNSQLSQSKRLQQMSRNSRAKLSKQSNYSTAINHNAANVAAAQLQQQNMARSASNHRTAGPKQKLMSTTTSNINKTATNKSSLTLMKAEEQKNRSDQISINSGQQIQIDAGIHGNLNSQMNLACNVGTKGTNMAMVKNYQQYTQKHKDLNRMAFSQLDFGLSQGAGGGSVQQKIPSKKKPLNQSHQLGIAPPGAAPSSSQHISGTHYVTSAASRSNHDSIQLQQQASISLHHPMTKKTQEAMIAGTQSPERVGNGQFNNFGMVYQQMSGQYASQGAGLQHEGQMKGMQKGMQQMQSGQKQSLGKSPYKHKIYNTTQQKVVQAQQKGGAPQQQMMSNLRSHTTASNGLSQSQSALKTQHQLAQNDDGGVQRTMTQITSKQQTKLPQGSLQGAGNRHASKDSSKPSHRSHRSRQSQTQHAGGYNPNELSQDAKQRGQNQITAQIQMARNQHNEMISGLGSQKLKRAHNTQRTQNYTQKQFYTTQQFSNLASSQAAFNSSNNPQILLSHQQTATKNISSSQQRKNLQIAADISGHKSTTAQLKPTNIAAKAIMNSDGRQRSRNPATALQGHTQSHNALLTSGLANPQGYATHGGVQMVAGAGGDGGDGVGQQNQGQYQGNQSQQQQIIQLGMNMSNQTQRPVSSTQRSNIKSIQTTKTLKTTLSKSQIEARGLQGAGREASHSSEMLTGSSNFHSNQMLPQSNQTKRTDSLSQSFHQPLKNAGAVHANMVGSMQSQQHVFGGGIPGGTQTAQLQGISKLIETTGPGDSGSGNVEYTQSKYRKRLNQQQSHDYQTGVPMAIGAGATKGKLGMQASVGTQGSRGGATKKMTANQHATSTQQHPSKLV